MTKTMTRLLAAATLCALPAAANAVVTRTVENGLLTGATGVVVEGQTYDVKFVDGTCASVYGACQASNFDFTTEASAVAAGNALLDQVLLDESRGNFDVVPSLTFGCFLTTTCNSIIAFAAPANVFLSARASNVGPPVPDSVSPFATLTSFDSTTSNSNNFARFTLSAVTPPAGTVPEPATWAMMIAGFGLTGAAMRRPRSRSVRFA